MFQDTRPADPGADLGGDPWAEFRITDPRAIGSLLRELRDRSTPVNLVSPDGAMLCVNVWTVDAERSHLNLSAEGVIDDLADVIDEPPELVKARLRELVPEYGLHTSEADPPAPARRAHAK